MVNGPMIHEEFWNLPKDLSIKKDQVWQKPVIQKLQPQIEFWAQHSPPEDLEALAKELRKHATHSSRLRSYLLSVALFRERALDSSTSLELVEKKYDQLRDFLKAEKIDVHRSQLSGLYTELYEILSQGYRIRGKEWSASWYHLMAERGFNPTDDVFEDGILALQESLRQRRVPCAFEQIYTLTDISSLARSGADLRLAIARALHLSGDSLSALANINEVSTDEFRFSWQKFRAQASLTGDLSFMFEALRKDLVSEEIFLEAKLWSFAVARKDWLKQDPGKNRRGKSYSLLREFVEGLEVCYDPSVSLDKRLEILGDLGEKASQLELPEYELLFWSAACRFLYRTKQKAMLRFCISQLQKVSLVLSSGHSDDVLGLACDILDGYEKPLRRLRFGWMDRTAAYGSLSFQVTKVLGRKKIADFLKGRPAKPLSASESARLGDILTQSLSSLKGPVMKIGQLLSYGVSDLPPQTRQLLENLPANSTPLDPKQLREVLARELKTPVEKGFKDFSDVPLGMGSIGQVHKARLHDGTEVAVKIQYPGISLAVAHDLRLVRSLAFLVKLFRPDLELKLLLRELETRVWEECDYLREGNLLNYFAHFFQNDSHVKIPRYFPEFSTQKVLTTELIQGKRFSEFNRSATQAERDLAGQTIVRFVVSSAASGTFNTDPHPGNFLFLKDQVAFLDFGSVKQWSQKASQPWRDLIASGAYHNLELYKKALCDMKLVVRPKDYSFSESFSSFASGEPGLWTTPGVQALNQKVMEEQFKRVFGRKPKPGQPRAMGLPSEFLFGFRVYFGHMSLVAKLGARADWNVLVREILEQGEIKEINTPTVE